MATNYTKMANFARKTRRRTPDNKPIKGREKEMVKNHAGGYVFKTSDMQRLLRFLILGADTNTFYQGQKTLVKQNAANVATCIAADPKAVVDMVVEVSTFRRALKQDAGLFVLAMVASYGVELKEPVEPVLKENSIYHVETIELHDQSVRDYKSDLSAYNRAAEARSYALGVLPQVARTPTALYMFANFVGDMRGWGRGLRRAFGNWYNSKRIDKLAMQAWKYKQRGGFSHRDVLRLAHPVTTDMARNKIFHYMTNPTESGLTKLPRFKNGRVKGFGAEVGEMGFDGDQGIYRTKALNQIAAAEEVLHLEGSGKAVVKTAVKLITDYRLTHEAVPSQLKQSPEIWAALLEDMPLQAMVTNLGRLAGVGLLGPMSDGQKKVIAALQNAEAIQRSGMHPMRFLIAAKQFGSGKGRSGMAWSPNGRIISALDDGFYASFGNVEPTGKNLLIAVDDSGSMNNNWSGYVMDIDGFYPSEAACAMALVLYRTEPNSHLITYNSGYNEIKGLTPDAKIADVRKFIGGGGATYTAAPLHYLLNNRVDVEGIVSFTDNETWAGGRSAMYGYRYSGKHSGKVSELLPQYSREVGHPVRLINCAVTATSCTDVDPNNKDMLETAGLDSNIPTLVGEFLAGRV